MTAVTVPLTAYCERAVDGLWAEPLNALSNLAFVLAAALVARHLSSADRPLEVWDVWLLVFLSAGIGIGSFLWHTLASGWAQLADVIPIALFISVFLVGFLVRIVGLSWTGVTLLFIVYQLCNYAVQASLPADFLNGSVFYLPTWIALLLMAGYCRYTGRPQAGVLLAMSAIFSLSLVLRTLDAAVCSTFPPGTHFAWHLLNAWVVYLAMRLLAH